MQIVFMTFKTKGLLRKFTDKIEMSSFTLMTVKCLAYSGHL